MASKTRLKWVLILTALFSIPLMCVLLYRAISKPLPEFFTTTSPGKTYTVSLKGQKTKPIFFTAEVRLDVFKSGTRLLSDKFLYSADGLDFPFEYSYPDHRWINEHVIQFYYHEGFADRVPDSVIVTNNTGKTIKYAKVESIDIFLFFEMQPGFKASIPISQSKGDSKWVGVEGEFSDGTRFSEFGADFRLKNRNEPKTFYVDIRADRTFVEMRN